jgi:hypothetical protein
MTAERRAQHIVRRPNGALVDEIALRDWIAAMHVPQRIVVARLSKQDGGKQG